MSEVSVSVIVPCFNQGEFLAEALDSVLAQTFENWECIIVNDGSTDQTETTAKTYEAKDRRFSLISQKNRGLPAARNTAITRAKGKFILPLDADDRIAPAYLAGAMTIFDKQPETMLVYGLAEFFGTKNGLWHLPEYTYKRLLQINLIFCSAVFKRADWEKIGGYDESLTSGFEDWDFWIRLLTPQCQVIKIEKVIFYYRLKDRSMLNDLLKSNADGLKWNLFEKHLELYRKFMPPPQYAYHEHNRMNDIMEFYRQSKEYKLGRWLFSPFRILKKLLHA